MKLVFNQIKKRCINRVSINIDNQLYYKVRYKIWFHVGRDVFLNKLVKPVQQSVKQYIQEYN